MDLCKDFSFRQSFRGPVEQAADVRTSALLEECSSIGEAGKEYPPGLRRSVRVALRGRPAGGSWAVSCSSAAVRVERGTTQADL